MSIERRAYEREKIDIPFIYSFDVGNSLEDGQWFESTTEDIGPVLVGGLAFHSDSPRDSGIKIRVTLFMDLNLKEVWEKDKETVPPIYVGEVVRSIRDSAGYKIAVIFNGFENEVEELLTNPNGITP